MYKIGEFSRITSLTIKALRYYHNESVLIPEVIDEMTGYRFYTKSQIERARAIRMLRDCTFTMKEIKDILRNIDDLEDLPYFMEEKITFIDEEMRQLRKVRKQLVMEKEKQKEVKNMNEYEVIQKTFDPLDVISIRYQGKYEECGPYIGKLFKEAKGLNKDVPMNLYHDEGMKEIADVEVCLPVKKETRTSEEVTFRTLPEQTGISVIHIGPYDQIGGAYEALMDYAKKNDIELTVPYREIYRKGPGMLFRGNPNKYVTEIFAPIE